MPRSLASMLGELDELPFEHSSNSTLGVTGVSTVLPQPERTTLIVVGDKIEERRLPDSPGVDGT